MTVARSSEPRAFKNRLIIFGLSTHPNSSLNCIVCPPPSDATHDFTRMSNSPMLILIRRKTKITARAKIQISTLESIDSSISQRSLLITSVIVYGDDQREGGSEWYYTGNRRCPRSLAVLNFHPTVHVVA